MSDPPLMDSSDCYATWSGPPTEDRGSVASKGKTVGFEKQNSVDQDMVRKGERVKDFFKQLEEVFHIYLQLCPQMLNLFTFSLILKPQFQNNQIWMNSPSERV